MSTEGRLVIKAVITICNGCKREITYYPDPPLVGAEALMAWTKTELRQCSCGAVTCDLKIPLPPDFETGLTSAPKEEP
ncbi:MAG TPA: hypothetical protein VE967_19525 [Gemmatimonadaceae bacterium]|nr:hypothetical protein [Gemmatimonadaceae bacterium]